MRSLRYQLAFIPLCRFLLLLIVFFYVFTGISTIWDFGKAMNVAARQISLSQLLVKAITLEIDFQKDNLVSEVQNFVYLKDNFEKNLKLLLEKRSPLTLWTGSEKTILPQYEKVKALWDQFKIPVEKLSDYQNLGDNQIRDLVNEIAESEYELYANLTQLILEYKKESNRALKNLFISLTCFFVLEIIFFILSWAFTSRWVTRPLNHLAEQLKKRKTIDDLDNEISSPVNNEIGVVINSINEASHNLRYMTRELSTSESRFRGLISHAADAIISVNLSGKITLVNQATCDIFGYSEEELLGRPITILIPPEYREMHLKGFKRYIETGYAKILGTIFEVDGISRSGESIPFSASIWDIEEDGGRKVFTAILRDAREATRKREELEKAHRKTEQAYKDLKKTQAVLLQSEKLASLGQLAAGVAHEINNPTGYILSNLNSLSQYSKDILTILEEQATLDTELKRFSEVPKPEDWKKILILLETIEQAKQSIDLNFIISDFEKVINESVEGAARIQEIVSELRNFSYFDRGALAYENIHSCIDSTIPIVWNELKYKATIEKEYGDIPTVLCNRSQIKQVIMNLLLNAAQAIEEKGTITIKTFKRKDSVVIELADDGTGIPENICTKIFDPFFTTKEVGEGTGLGLNISYNILKNHGGSIEVKSVLGRGTTFTLSLPLTQEEQKVGNAANTK